MGVTRMCDVIPHSLRDRMPESLQDAQIIGVDSVGVSDDVRLYGPPGTGKTFQSAARIAVRAEKEGLAASDVTVVTYRKSLANGMWGRMISWGVYSEIVDEDQENPYPQTDPLSPRHSWGTIHAVASRAIGFHDRFADDTDSDLEGMRDEAAEQAFCAEMGIAYQPSKPWFSTPWTVFSRLYGYCRSNLLDIGGWPSSVPKIILSPLTADSRAMRLLEQFNAEWGRPRRADPAARFKAVTERYETWKRQNNVYDFWQRSCGGDCW